jgi:WD40 repeat protein
MQSSAEGKARLLVRSVQMCSGKVWAIIPYLMMETVLNIALVLRPCRLGRVSFHPMGQHLGTASYDLTWRLWDIATGDCLLEQVCS